jgi:hypothetical protein
MFASTSLRRSLCAVVGLAALAAGCRAQAGPEFVRSSDRELGALASELLPDLARRSGMELLRPVRLEKRSREQLARYLRAKLDQELPPEEARARTEAYARLGLVPADLDLRGLLLDLYGEQVAGFYEPDSTALYVLDDQPEEAMRALLVHELVHAVQDQSTDLRALTADEVGNDRATAAMAAIEGHATLVMFEYLTEQMTGGPIDLGAVPDFGAQVGPALEAMSSQFPALAGAPRVVRESLIFPYVAGATYVQGLWGGGTRHHPFDDAMPRSTEQVVDPGAAGPLDVRIDIDGARRVLDDTLGQLELRVLVEEVLGAEPAAARGLVAGWDGDRWVLAEGPDGVRFLALVTVWDAEAARDAFVRAVGAARSAFSDPVSVDSLSLDGRPASLLRLGSSGGYVVRPWLASLP